METRASYYQVEYYAFMIRRLEKERSKIIQRGRLTAYENNRLYSIDGEIDYWTKIMKKANSILNPSYEEPSALEFS